MALPLAGASEVLCSRRPRRARGFAGRDRTPARQEGDAARGRLGSRGGCTFVTVWCLNKSENISTDQCTSPFFLACPSS